MADENCNIEIANNMNQRTNFICGVVEGFYGRPWTTEQRKDLFVKQQKWGMNCYLYAPKDDCKHRAFWREMYTVEEAEHLRALISEAKLHNVDFYYAISPGLDITYSSAKEVTALKRKLEQVSQLGCSAFAILFDDIDPEMSSQDKEVFTSFAHAQISVTNEIYTHLSQPRFMFCPTQYCSTRAVPSVQASEYLSTIGTKLAPEILVMWTGPRVISKILTIEHVREVSAVVRRPLVIWDNLHANDYDQARLFLGPYCGRTPDLIPLLGGVVANPNCEYGPNFVAIHTLAQWSQSVSESSCDYNDSVRADIQLETEGQDPFGGGDECPTGLSPTTYHPKRALRAALVDWLPEFNRAIVATGSIKQPQILVPIPVPIVPSVNTCMSLTTTTGTTTEAKMPGLPFHPFPPAMNMLLEKGDPDASSLLPPQLGGGAIMNSLVSENKVVVDMVVDSTGADSVEPMDCNPTPPSSTPSLNPTEEETTQVSPLSPLHQGEEAMTLDSTCPPSPVSDDSDHLNTNCIKALTVDDLQLLADLFYLPFEHGRQGVQLLTEFNWLKSNANLIANDTSSTGLVAEEAGQRNESFKPEVQEWHARAARFDKANQSIRTMASRLVNIRNRSLLHDLHPYVWEMRGVVSLLNSYVQWLAIGQVSPTIPSSLVHGSYTWFSKGWGEAFMSGDQEPWVFRGGLTAELQRLIPVDSSTDLFMYKTPEVPLQQTYVIRPLLPGDTSALFDLVLRTSLDGSDGSSIFESHLELPGDVMMGSYIEGTDDVTIMVVEDDSGQLVGYCTSAISGVRQATRQATFLQCVRGKYPEVITAGECILTPCEELLAAVHSDVQPPPEQLNISHPAVMSLAILSSIPDESIGKRLMTCMLASLRHKGTFGAHVAVRVSQKHTVEMYSRLGFLELMTRGTTLFLGRSF